MRPVTSFPSVWGARPSPWARAPGVPIAIVATAAASFLSGEAKPYGAHGTSSSSRPYGASPTPPELTAAQWAALTPEAQAAFLKADSDTKKLIADGITTGARAAVDLIIKGIETADAAAARSNATEIEKIRAANDLAKAKIQAQTQIELAKLGQFTPIPVPGGGGMTALTAAPASWLTSGGTSATWAAQTDATRAQWIASHEGAVATPAPSTGISGAALAVGGLAAVGIAWAAFGGKSKGGGGGGGRRRRRRR